MFVCFNLVWGNEICNENEEHIHRNEYGSMYIWLFGFVFGGHV